MHEYKPGSRWKSAVCDAEFVIVRAPSVPGELTCGGVAVQAQAAGADRAGAPDGLGEGVAAGKRYTDPHSGIEVLGTKAGLGSLGFAGHLLARKDAKPLPASD